MCILGAFVGPRVFIGPHKLHRTSEWHRAESRMTEFQFQGEQFDDRAAWWRRHDDLSEGNQSASCSAPRWHKGDAFGRLETAASVTLQLATTSTERPRYSQAQLNRRADNRLDCFNYGKKHFCCYWANAAGIGWSKTPAIISGTLFHQTDEIALKCELLEISLIAVLRLTDVFFRPLVIAFRIAENV